MNKVKKRHKDIFKEIVLFIAERGSNDLPGKELAKRCGITYNSLYTQLKYLKTIGLMHIESPPVRKKGNNLYYINFRSEYWNENDFCFMKKEDLMYVYKRYGIRLK